MKEKIAKANVEHVNEDKKIITAKQKLEQLIVEGYYTKESVALKGHVIEMKVLSSKERGLSYDLAGFDELLTQIDLDKATEEEKEKHVERIKDQYTRNKCAMLAYSIIKIDDVNMDDAVKSKFDDYLAMPDSITDILYFEYQRMENEYVKETADLDVFKKKF